MTTLSTSWKNLRVLYLDLDWCVMSGYGSERHLKKCENYKPQFIENVDHVLRLYKDINITKFRFSFCYTNKRYSTDVDKWINFAADNKGLESPKLEFICIDKPSSHKYVKCNGLYVICTSFLTRFRDLRNLRLDNCILKIDGDLSFKRLVKVDINYVVLDGAGAQWEFFLAEAASAVEWLRLRSCNLPKKFRIGNNLRSLNFLMIESCVDVREIDINSRSLKFLEFIGEAIAVFSSLNSPRLENVYLYVLENKAYDVQRFFEKFACVSCGNVTLFLQGMSSVISKLPTQSQPGTLFQSVSRLNINLVDDTYNYWFDLEEVLPSVLKAFPLLHKLCVQLPKLVRNAITKEIPVDNLHVYLKEVEFGGFEIYWLFFATYLWRSCPLLDQMVLNKIGKSYDGCGLWIVYINRRWFDPQDPVEIAAALKKGNGLSPTARLIISDVRNCNYLAPPLKFWVTSKLGEMNRKSKL